MKTLALIICTLFMASVFAADLRTSSPSEVVELYRAQKISKNDLLNYFRHERFPFEIVEIKRANKNGKTYILWHVKDRNGKNIFDYYVYEFKATPKENDFDYTWRESKIPLDVRDYFVKNRNKGNDFKIAFDAEISMGDISLDTYQVDYQSMYFSIAYQEFFSDEYFLRGNVGVKKFLSVEYSDTESNQSKSSSFYPEFGFLAGQLWHKVRLGIGAKNTNSAFINFENDLFLKFINLTAFTGEVEYSLSPTFAARLNYDLFTSMLNDQASGSSYRLSLIYLPKSWPKLSLEAFLFAQSLSSDNNSFENDESSLGLRLNYRW